MATYLVYFDGKADTGSRYFPLIEPYIRSSQVSSRPVPQAEQHLQSRIRARRSNTSIQARSWESCPLILHYAARGGKQSLISLRKRPTASGLGRSFSGHGLALKDDVQLRHDRLSVVQNALSAGRRSCVHEKEETEPADPIQSSHPALSRSSTE